MSGFTQGFDPRVGWSCLTLCVASVSCAELSHSFGSDNFWILDSPEEEWVAHEHGLLLCGCHRLWQRPYLLGESVGQLLSYCLLLHLDGQHHLRSWLVRFRLPWPSDVSYNSDISQMFDAQMFIVLAMSEPWRMPCTKCCEQKQMLQSDPHLTCLCEKFLKFQKKIGQRIEVWHTTLVSQKCSHPLKLSALLGSYSSNHGILGIAIYFHLQNLEVLMWHPVTKIHS